MNNLVDKYKLYTQTHPNRSKMIMALSALAILFVISFAVALLTQEDKTPQVQAPTAVQQQTAQITITKDGFVPASLSVKKGTKIIWTNSDEATHQLQANPHPTGESLPGLKSEVLTSGQTYEYTADISGTFDYHDHLNPTNNGKLEIQE